MSQKRILLFVVALVCGLGLILPGCDKNALPDWEDPWPTGGEAPNISAPSPDSGKVGDAIKLAGSNMNATAANNFVMMGSGTGLYLCEVTAASASEITITVPDGANNLPFDEWTIIDTIMYQSAPDSEVASIDTTRNVADTADSLYDTSWTVWLTPETVTTGMAQTSAFEIKLSARGSELWSNTVAFNVIPPDEDREYRWGSLVVISKGE